MLQSSMREFKHDAIGAHLIGIHYNEALKTWSEGESSPETVLGALKKGQAAHVFRGIGGPDFNLMYSENTKNVFQPGADVIGGFCFLSRGLVTVQKRVVDRNGKEFKVQIDLAGILPKPLFEGGAELQQQSQRLLNGARLSKNGWQIKTPGKIKGVPFGSLLKALRYFEIAQTSGGRLILMIPTNEYASSVAANAVLLKTSPAEARRAVYAVGKIYARTLQKLGRAFFPSVKLEVVLTHDLSFQKKLKRFEKQNQKQFNEAKIGQADGFISGYTPEQKRIIRRLWEEETANYLRLFSYIFSRETPTIFGLHARDFVGYPLEGLALAEKIVGKQAIQKNIGFIGVTGGPALSNQNPFPPMLGLTLYGQESKKLGKTDKSAPADIDIRLDEYWGPPVQRATTTYKPKKLGGHPLRKLDEKQPLTRSGGKCAMYHYVRNLGPYVNVVPESNSIKTIRQCWHNKTHIGCKQLFNETYTRLAQRLR